MRFQSTEKSTEISEFEYDNELKNIFIAGIPSLHDEMVKFGEYQKKRHEDTNPYSAINVTIVEFGDNKSKAQTIKKNMKNISNCNTVFILSHADGMLDDDTMYLKEFAAFLKKTVIPVNADSDFFK